jgi:hypothetical protein
MNSTWNVRSAMMAVMALVTMAGSAVAQADDGKVPPPPWQVHVSDYLIVGVVWNEATLRKALPPGIKAVAGMTGGIAVYKSDGGYGISPYDSAYGYVDIEGFDTAQGTKGRWILQGMYGPDEKVAAAIRGAYGWSVRAGAVTFTETARGRRGVASIGGRDVLDVELNLSALPCSPVGGINHYVAGTAAKPVVNQIPFTGQWCGGEPVKANVVAPADDPFAALVPAKIIWAGEFRDGAIAFTRPVAKP